MPLLKTSTLSSFCVINLESGATITSSRASTSQTTSISSRTVSEICLLKVNPSETAVTVITL